MSSGVTKVILVSTNGQDSDLHYLPSCNAMINQHYQCPPACFLGGACRDNLQ